MAEENGASFLEIIACRAREIGSKTAFTFSGKAHSFTELWEGIQRFGSYLISIGLQHGDRVVLALPNGLDFFFAFYGIQLAGGIAVPLFPGSGPERILSITTLCDAAYAVLSDDDTKSNVFEFLKAHSIRRPQTLSVAESLDQNPMSDFPKTNPEDIAYIQYTSGSTGNPKGVMLSHKNLITNIHQMIKGMEIGPDDIFVSWLPVYHDMGLILMTMVPFYLAAETHLLSTNIRNILDWLNVIDELRATFTAAPDFAYRLVLRYLGNERKFNLKSLRVALNAAEPVRSRTVEEFERVFNLKNIMTAGYGLAEATVGVCMSAPGRGIHTDPRGFVSVGKPFLDVEIQILQQGKPVSMGETGEIAIHSPANTHGYWNNPDETEKLFWKEGYILSGDLGYLDSKGELFIVGRSKSIIKRWGETISPQEIEEIIDNLPGVRFSAVVGIDKGGIEGEQIYIFVEIRPGIAKTESKMYDFILNAVQAIYKCLGYRPGRVYLLKPHSIPKTDNGKIRYTLLKERYLNGDLGREKLILYPNN
jgi:acyl-CoA synthetase (AMP-forming)/AMP-acid ligase II